MQERASKKQQELLSFVDGFIKGNGYGPSYREVMKALGYKSVSTVAIHIEGLISKGYLARRDKSARSLEVVTLRSDRAPARMRGEPLLEDELMKRVETKNLESEQKRIIKQAFELLGLTTAAANIQIEETDGPTT
jgi:SOS-response transcriptional repressor LexA